MTVGGLRGRHERPEGQGAVSSCGAFNSHGGGGTPACYGVYHHPLRRSPHVDEGRRHPVRGVPFLLKDRPTDDEGWTNAHRRGASRRSSMSVRRDCFPVAMHAALPPTLDLNEAVAYLDPEVVEFTNRVLRGDALHYDLRPITLRGPHARRRPAGRRRTGRRRTRSRAGGRAEPSPEPDQRSATPTDTA
jgi:hypothetical protein